MLLDEFYYYKNQLMEDLLTNEKIVELLCDDGVIVEPEDLMYTQVFPYEYIPETVEHAHTFICCDVDIQRASNKTFYQPTLYIWIFTHKSKLRLPEGGVRTDQLACEVAKTITGSRYYGLGELEMYSSRRFAPIIDYQGKALTFQTRDFNRVTPTGKPVPSHRKE